MISAEITIGVIILAAMLAAVGMLVLFKKK
jgi:hypothetical protein